VRRSDPFINDAAEFHGSGRRCNVETAVICRFVGSWLSIFINHSGNATHLLC
jgi:hypothetical protein